MTVGRISVARGEKPLYMLDNVVYLRQWSSDVQAQPDEIISLVTRSTFYTGRHKFLRIAHSGAFCAPGL